MIPCHKRESLNDPCEVGDFCIAADRKTIFIVLPTNGKMWFSVNLDQTKGRPCWTISGSDDAPSLTPSLVITEWHGYMTNGQLIPC